MQRTLLICLKGGAAVDLRSLTVATVSWMMFPLLSVMGLEISRRAFTGFSKF